jgi:GNAT superfamily N-acetyltransferase
VRVELVPAGTLSTTQLVGLVNAAYEGYLVPFRVDEAALRSMTRAFDLVAEASRVAVRDGEPVGVANLALRGDRAWIGGLGVVPAARRQGIGELLMRAVHEEARARGASLVWLEVIEGNESAFRLYEKLGYGVVRDLQVWTLSAETRAGSAREVPAARAHERIRRLRTAREPWQRADETLAHYDDALGLETSGGAAVFRAAGGVQLVQIAGGDAAELLRTMRSRGEVSALNVPVGDPAEDALRELGAVAALRQHELVLDLQTPG